MNMFLAIQVLTCAITLIEAKQFIAPCNRLYLRGLDNEALFPWISYAGVFVHFEDAVNLTSDVLYRHEQYSHVQFLYNGTLQRFLLTDSGSVIVAGITNGWNPQLFSSSPFSDMVTEWLSYNVTTTVFQSTIHQSAIIPTCVDEEFVQCDSGIVKLNFTDVIQLHSNDSIPTNVYHFNQVLGLYHNLRPVFSTNVSRSVLYLYHLGNSWMIGYDYKDTEEAVLISSDKALRPEFITSDWYLNGQNNVSLIPVKALKIKCLGLINAFACMY